MSTFSKKTATLRGLRVIIANVLFFGPLLLYLSSCAHGVDDVSQPPSTTPSEDKSPTVTALLNDELKNLLVKSPQLRAILVLDSQEYEMNIDNGAATWQQKDLPVDNPYSIKARFEVALDSQSGASLILAQTTVETHDFSDQANKTFEADTLASTVFDDDGDGMNNLAELLIGGNPYSDAPTITSASQVTVLEKSIAVQQVIAISPRSNPIWSYSIVASSGDDGNLFSIDAQSGLLSFKNAVFYDNSANPKNDYTVIISVHDGSISSQLPIMVTLTNVFDLNVKTGLKQLEFFWYAYPQANYYKILQSNGGGGTPVELPNSGNITELSYIHPVAVHLYDKANAQFFLKAYKKDIVDQVLVSSPSINLTPNFIETIGYFKANAIESGHYGSAVALSGDGNTLAVGAPLGNGKKGIVYVYSHSTGVWLYHSSIIATNADINDRFGSVLALSADGTTLAVGASDESSDTTGVNSPTPASGDLRYNNNAPSSGAVYVFDRTTSSDIFTSSAYVKPTNTGSFLDFGSVLALSADGNVLVVGALHEDSDATGVITPPPTSGDPLYNSNAPNSGAVYVFSRNSNAEVFAPQAFIKAPNSDKGDLFGTTLSLSSDGNTLAVAATYESSDATGVYSPAPVSGDPLYNNNALLTGAVYVFSRTTNADTFTLDAYIKSTNPDIGDLFGNALALNADGTTLAVGASREGSDATGVIAPPPISGDPLYNNNAAHSGAVYVYGRTTNADVFTSEAYIKANNTSSFDEFGNALSLNADGNMLVVGALLEDSDGTGVFTPAPASGDPLYNKGVGNSGAVYLFKRPTSSDIYLTGSYVKATNPDADDKFGTALCISADGNTLAVGAIWESSDATGVNTPAPAIGDPLNNNNTQLAGAVYLY